MTKKQTTPASTFDVSLLSITDEPFLGRRAKAPSKYEPIFSKLKLGQRLVCPSDAAPRIGSSLKKWLIAQGHKNPVVKAASNYHDGKGGVWWLAVDGTPRASINPQTTWADVAKVKK